ncbi:pilus assembly protein [Mesorhizobium sp. WSM4935]|uniref:TadE/TadG family type IV pilus assembly protein n=1 Tax=Mesorhizobium sp. WSM4935 TaxID=3038547 RepID=UPI00241545F4|nr:TadE/TadG family type IV pilus assembly protein [Mesorhizobium sp. WSM4935]MDG4878453.1 pilus assembly protein [Mesorhizobium sp. WSM4935]
MSRSARKFSPAAVAGALRRFLARRDGSMMPMMVLLTIPLVAAVGFSVDYTSAVTTRSDMQNALDAAIIAVTTLPTTTSFSDRQAALQQAYAANSGQGTATLTGVNVDATGTATFTATASYPMPTSFMQVVRINTVPVGVGSSVRKTPALVQTTFKVTKVSGYWAKTMTLWGTKFGQTTPQKLMTIGYTYNGYGDPKGYGTTVVNTINGSTSTMVQKQVCTTGTLKSLQNSVPAGTVIQTDNYGTSYYCVDTFYPANGAGAVIDVSQMDQLYLEMDVPSGNPKVLKSNDPTTSNRLYIGTSPTNLTEVATGQKVDIFTAVPCGQTGYQAWEDGGNAVPAPVSNADFFYTVQGKCDYNQRPSETVLTQ